ncbi:MAG: hypothetical protein K9M45_02895 [Kiritimatiellales bacterium]|nr:hypothetical protein [Kiritimatiellales bacterium]
MHPDVLTDPVAGHRGLPHAEIRPVNGAAALLFVDGRMYPRIAISSTSNHSASIADKLDCGMRLVEKLPLDPDRMYIFLGTPELTSEERIWIDRHIRRNGNWVVSLLPQGAYHPDTESFYNLKNSVTFHGIQVVQREPNGKNLDILYAADNPML